MEYSSDWKSPFPPHPLSIAIILNRIFAQLSIKDLLACRRVCHLWMEIIAPHFKKHLDDVTIIFNENDRVVSGVFKRLEGCDLGPTNFCFNDTSLTSSAMTKLLNQFGTRITSLTLNFSKSVSDPSSDSDSWITIDSLDSDCCTNCTCSDDSLTSEISSESNENSKQIINSDLFERLLCEQCTNLEVLNLKNLPSIVKGKAALAKGKPLHIKDIYIYNEYRTPPYGLVFLENLFEQSSQLRNVHFKANYGSYEQEKILLESLFTSKRMMQLKSLRLNSMSSHMFCKYLLPHLDNSSAITEFSIDNLECDYIEGTKFHDFFASIGSNLKLLEIGLDVNENAVVKFPVMQNLLDLKIDCKGFKQNVSTAFLQEFRFSAQFPKLVKLHITLSPFVKEYGLFNQLQPKCVTLKELVLPTMTEPSMISNISEIFPTLTKLTLTAESLEVFRQIWSSLVNLKELTLCISKRYSRSETEEFGLDSLLTGIPQNVCEQLKIKKKFDSVSLADVRAHHSIVDLKYLERFKIHCGSDVNSWSGHIQPEHKVSDVSAFLAFSTMKSLQRIDLGMGNDVLTPIGENKICSELQLVKASGTIMRIFSKSLAELGHGTEFECLLQMGFG